MKKNLKGKILDIKTVAKDTVKLQFSTVLENILPGQFVSILIPNKTLRRPFSVADFTFDHHLAAISEPNRHPEPNCHPESNRHPELVSGSPQNPASDRQYGIITILFKLKGDGTNYLKSLKTGDTINYLAPLGNTFNLANNNRKALLIGAGIGIAPMLYLKKVLNKNSVENFLISGFKDEDEVIEGSDSTVIGGSVMDKVQALIDEFKPEILYSCGPKVVLKMVCDIAKKNGLYAEIAMEKVMACGIGVCRGCVIKLDKGNGVQNASVCADGPVFSGTEVIWEE